MNNATVALRESRKWIGFKIPLPVIRSSIGMLYIFAALPRYKSQSTTKPVKDCDFTEPERLTVFIHLGSRCGERTGKEGEKSRADH